MNAKDYYQTLGIEEGASKDEVKKAFKRLARKFHPDKNSAPDATDRFKEINEAYQVLSDDEKRAQYDNFRRYGGMGGMGGGMPQGAGASAGGPGGFGHVSIDDLFGSLFGGGDGGGMGGGRGGRSRPARGTDVSSSIRVPFETALHGGKITIRFHRDARCDTCDGSGAAPGSKVSTCTQCNGIGHVAMGGGPFTVQRPCPVCGGRGKTTEKPCTVCRTRGIRPKAEEVTVSIPAGVADTQVIRLAGLGNAGEYGRPAGDLLLEVRVNAKPGFRRDGRNVHSDVQVPMIDAALGTELEVDTLDGNVGLRIPPGTQPGATLRLREKGFPAGPSGRGDHFVHVKVVVPKQLNDAQKAALELFRDTLVPKPGG